jgi:hypothetical protein
MRRSIYHQIDNPNPNQSLVTESHQFPKNKTQEEKENDQEN